MAGLETAASVIAVLELSAKVSSLCFQYYSAVKNARSDVEYLCGELSQLKLTLEGGQQLLESPDGARLKTSQQLRNGLSGCSSQLIELQSKLDNIPQLGTRQKIMTRFGSGALTWPFERKEVDKILESLRRYREIFTAALTVDQTLGVLSISQELVLSKLPTAKDAAFDSHADEHDTRCHAKTRVDLQKEIIRWADSSPGECIFWLNGMAGTGKSTISRTLAQTFASQGRLGASFFFKRGERDRSSAALLFTTISAQLITWEPALAPYVRASLDANHTIPSKTLREQFQKLILEPLSKLERHQAREASIVLVVDALDECERDDDIKVIIYLLSQTNTLKSVLVRAFVTSRPELPVRLGFNDIRSKYQDVVLHEIPVPIIEHDITAYLQDELAKIRDQYNKSVVTKRQIDVNWPPQSTIKALVEMAVPLFIFAATACRFLRDRRRGSPDQQLENILKYQTSYMSKLDSTYLPVLNQLITDLFTSEKEGMIVDFRRIVGSIVLLSEPLSISSLSTLIGVPETIVENMLDLLHSVLSIPSDPNLPIRPFHLSFRNFLVDPDRRNTSPFWIDERATHQQIAARCLEILLSSNHLKKDICNIRRLGATRLDVEPAVITKCLPAHVRYACLYWVYHLEQSKAGINDRHPAYIFLKGHFLHWIEALSLLGKTSQSIAMISSLQTLISPEMSSNMSALLHDAARFVPNCYSIIDVCPLQLYASAIVFAPQESLVRDIFKAYVSEWIALLPKAGYTWNACLQTLEGHSQEIYAVAFSPSGRTIASASGDSTVLLWHTATGEPQQILKADSERATAVAFSPDGRRIVSASGFTVWLWDTATGELQWSVKAHSGLVWAVVFSPDGMTIASASHDKTVRLWDVMTGNLRHILNGHRDWVWAIAFSPDNKTLASASSDRTIYLWDITMGKLKQNLRGHDSVVWAVTFSPDGTVLASASGDKVVQLWDIDTCRLIQTLKGHRGSVNDVKFSPDGRRIVSVSSDTTVRLWDTATGKLQQTLKGHNGSVNAVTFSPDNRIIASASQDKTVWLWDTVTNKAQQTFKGHNSSVRAVAISPEGTIIASAADDRTVRLWDAETGELQQTLNGHRDIIWAIAFSPDGMTIASASNDNTARLWKITGELQHILNGHSDPVWTIAFSPDGTKIASVSCDDSIGLWSVVTGELQHTLKHFSVWAVTFSHDGKIVASGSKRENIRLWDVMTGKLRHTLDGHKGSVNAVVFSPNSTRIASASDDKTVRLWDTAMGNPQHTLKAHSKAVSALAFSSDGKMIASASADKTVRLWNAATGELQKMLNIGHHLTDLSFIYDDQSLKTNLGLVPLRSFANIPPRKSPAPMFCSLGTDWFTCSDENVLWIPPNNRPVCTATHDNTFVMGYNSGMVNIIRFAAHRYSAL